jgi:hypothetical protein
MMDIVFVEHYCHGDAGALPFDVLQDKVAMIRRLSAAEKSQDSWSLRCYLSRQQQDVEDAAEEDTLSKPI